MKPEDKKKLQDAWRKSVAKDPRADEFMRSLPGGNTPRKFMEESLASEEYYQKLEKTLQEQGLTIDQYIQFIEKQDEYMEKHFYPQFREKKNRPGQGPKP